MEDVFGDEIIYFSKENNDYGFLSNFYPARTNYNGIAYPTSEHAYQAQKAKDVAGKLNIAAAATPYQSKIKANNLLITKSDRVEWDKIKVSIMFQVVHAKFMQNRDLMKKLVETGEKQLVEYTTWNDTFWGVNTGYEGKNMLGVILTRVRALIVRQEQEILTKL